MMGGSVRGVSSTEIHDILRNERRGRAIECLLEADGPVTVRELSERIAEMETGESPPPCEARKSVYVTLHQNHLSKLEEAGIVEHDSDEVREGERIDEVRGFIDDGDDYTWWAEACSLISVIGLFVIGIVTLGLPAVPDIEVVALSVLFLSAVLFVSLYTVASYRGDGPRGV